MSNTCSYNQSMYVPVGSPLFWEEDTSGPSVSLTPGKSIDVAHRRRGGKCHVNAMFESEGPGDSG